MLMSGPTQAGAKTGPRREAAIPPPPLPYPQAAPAFLHAEALRGRRALLTSVAAQRRPINRNLLDNVDNTVTDGYPSYASIYMPSEDGLQSSSSGDWPSSTPYPCEPAPRISNAGSTPEDWPHDPQTLRPPPSPRQQLADTFSFRAMEPPIYDANGYAYGAAPLPADRSPTEPPYWAMSSTDRPSSPVANAKTTSQPAAAEETPARPTAQGTRPSQQDAQQPPPPSPLQQPYSRATIGADWGEVDPLTDWGGFAYSEASGWDETYDGIGLGPSPFPSSHSPKSGVSDGAAAAAAAAGPSSSDGTYRAWGSGGNGSAAAGPSSSSDGTSYGAWGSSGAAAAAAAFGESSRDWSREGSGWPDGETASWARPREGWAAGQRFTQDDRYNSGPGPAGSGGAASAAGGGVGTSSSQPPPADAFRPSDIILLPGRDASAILPLAPMTAQVDFFQPRTLQERIVQFVGSIGTSVILSKAAVLAGPALLYPIWSPWIRAGFRNLDLYSKNFACVGLWRAEVLDVQINGLAIGGMLISKQPPVVAMLVGDPWAGGARVALDLPYQLRSETIRVGDSVELLVLSRDDRFTSFKVVREVYLPQSGLWLYEYPYVNRDLFVAVSVAIEKQRRAEAAVAAEAQYYTYDIPAGPGTAPPGATGPGSSPGTAPEFGNMADSGSGRARLGI